MARQIPTEAKGWRLAHESVAEGAEEIAYTTLDPAYPYFVVGVGEMNIAIRNLTNWMKEDTKLHNEGARGGVHWFIKVAKQLKKSWRVWIEGGEPGERVEFFRTKKEAVAFTEDWMRAHPTTPALPRHRQPATKQPRTPAAASDMATAQTGLGGGIPPIPGMGAAAAPKPKQAAKPAKKAAAPKPKSKAKNGKTATGITLTAAQKKRLAAKGSITIKRDGKFVTVRG